MGDASADLPAEASWNSLLGYYAATQRMDPRGAITEFADRHAQSWLLFETQGRWWADATLDIPVAALSETFPEALSRRNVRTAALGWPLSAFETREGMTFLPALILAAEWSLVGGRLQVRPGSAAPVLNPRWLKEVVSRSRWRESELVEALVPAGEEQDLAAIGERLRHALSSLGAGTLNPGCLSPEISAGSEGLRNAAALFLPDDRSFTRGAAEDLETLRDWTPERRAPTALSALLEGEGAAAPTADAPPLMATGPLTDQQAGAADSALSAPITLIQGPPGTGKSEVILSLVVTTLVSGGSVLFAARNHQALGEVEKRLEALAPDAGLMVRARDGEGV
ncbi:MAG: AAA domain-containing protein, partial [Albimonas sp.]|uniref:AAA domain-containing protein n=1 Tax=Albimonas sp. TaxID=1872425 RepID=UPI004057A5B8